MGSQKAAQYLIPARETRIEMRVSNSRFIATIAPAFSVEDARAFIDRIRQEFSDATHNVPAYVIGHGATVIAHANDDGEPSGTAGRPALAVLRGSGLGDAVVVVTRYFGGTKLGTGGLVRAYSDAVRQVLVATPRAMKLPTHTAVVEMPYGAYEQVRRLVPAHRGQVVDAVFAADVTLTVQLPVDSFAAFQAALQELSRGQVAAEVIETNQATIVPVDTQE
ncbi:MAG: YigZ family protein [Anaerolineae bacterium]|jgi:uncharacterized YigZ family protein